MTPQATATCGTMRRPKSEAAFEDAQQYMPGGVNSPVRAFKGVGGNPVVIQKAKGAYVWDVDGNRYVDYVGSYGPMILGHAHPAVIGGIQQTAEDGTSFGAPTVLENKLAKMVIDAVPALDKVRFVNSGTEACLSAIRLARAFTGREKLIKFEGCYHGHADSFLVKAGSGVATLGKPDSPGVPKETAGLTLTATYNDLSSVEALLKNHPEDVAAIMVEPVAGNMGCVPPQDGFLEGLRRLATEYGALLVFDEVMTGFRVHYGGAQALYQVEPDLSCFGKIIGGGLPVGAYGGKANIMAHVAPEGSMYQAGTLSGNPLAMRAGVETLTRLKEPGFYDQLNQRATDLADGFKRVCQEYHVPHQVNQVGSMVSLFFNEQPVTNFTEAAQSDRELFNRVFWRMLDAGIYMAPSPFEAAFVSMAHTQQDVEQTLEALSSALAAEKA